jgi:hypothetical protein
MSSIKPERTITKLFKYIDLFGMEPKINIKQYNKYNTFFGGFVSIFIYILVVLGFIYFGQELILKANPTVIVSNQYDTNPLQFNLTKEKFNFFIKLQDVNSNYYIDPQIFYFSVKHVITTRTLDSNGSPSYTTQTIPLKLEVCNMTRHFPNFEEQFTGQDLGRAMCVYQGDSDSLYISGIYGSEVYGRITIDILPCKNSTTSDVKCKPQEDIDKMLEGGFFSIFLIDTIFDPKNYTHPYTYVGRNFYTSMSKNFYKSYSLWFKNIDYLTDSGFLLQDLKQGKYMQMDDQSEIMDYRSGTAEFFRCVLRTSNNRDIYYRKYVKLQDILANMGGLIKGIMVCVQAFFLLFQRTYYYLFLIEELYASYALPRTTTHGNESGGGERSGIQLPDQSQSKLENNFVGLKNNNLFPIEDNLTTQRIKELMSTKDKKKLNVCKIFGMPFLECLGVKSKSVNMYQCGVAKIRQNTDIIKLYNLVEELDLLKAVLFPENSRKLIGFLMKYKVLDKASSDEKFSMEEVYDNYKGLASSEVNNSLVDIFEMKLNLIGK